MSDEFKSARQLMDEARISQEQLKILEELEEVDSSKSANEYQIGGSHYQKVPGEQLWDRLVRLYGLDKAYVFFVGNIISYIERYRDKEGVKDLKKAAHYLQKLIELEEAAQAPIDTSSAEATFHSSLCHDGFMHRWIPTQHANIMCCSKCNARTEL